MSTTTLAKEHYDNIVFFNSQYYNTVPAKPHLMAPLPLLVHGIFIAKTQGVASGATFGTRSSEQNKRFRRL
jgi:hypothetical protein